MMQIEEVLKEYDLIRNHLRTDFVHWCASDTKLFSLNNFMREVQKNSFSFYNFLLTNDSLAWLARVIQKYSFGQYLSSHLLQTLCVGISFLLLLVFCILLLLFSFNAIDRRRWEDALTFLRIHQNRSRLVERDSRTEAHETRNTLPSARYLNRFRRGFHYIFYTKVSLFFFLLVAMFLVIISVTSLPYLVMLYKSQIQFQCGSLETFDAYFFGSSGIQPNNGFIARDWKGSYAQLKGIQDLEFHLTFNQSFSIPKDFVLHANTKENQSDITESNETYQNISLCPMCYNVVKDFFSENGLKNAMITTGKALKERTHRMGLLYYYLTSKILYKGRTPVKHTVQHKTSTYEFTYEFFGKAGFVLNNVTKLFYDELEMKFGFLSEMAPKLLFEKMSEGFSSDSPIFAESMYALNTGKDRILQIDSIIRKHYWKMRYVVYKVNKLMLILFIVTLILSIVCGAVGCFLFFHLISACRNSSNLSRIRRQFNKIIFIFILIGCVTLFVSAIQYFLTTVVYDACRFSFTNLLGLGQWSDLPQNTFHSNKENVTDMELILDTCLKTGESGDIASVINVRNLVDKVIYLTESKILQSKTNFYDNFKNFFNVEILKSFLYYSTNAHRFLVIPPFFFIEDDDTTTFIHVPRYFDDGTNFVSFAKSIPTDLYLVPLANLAGQDLKTFNVLFQHIHNSLSYHPDSIYTILEKLNSLPAMNNVQNVSFCTTSMDQQKACSLASPNTLHVGFIKLNDEQCTSNATLFNNGLVCTSVEFYNTTDSTWESSLALFTNKDDVQKIIRYAYLLAVHDYMLRTPLYLSDSLPFLKESDTYFDYLNVDDAVRQNFFLLKYLQNSNCVVTTEENGLIPNYCKVGDLLDLWSEDLSAYTKEVLDSVQALTPRLMQFHSSLENVMTTLVAKAKSLLEKNNCQVLGTSVDIIFKVSCSNLFTSSQTLTVLYFIISILCFLSAFLTSCIQLLE